MHVYFDIMIIIILTPNIMLNLNQFEIFWSIQRIWVNRKDEREQVEIEKKNKSKRIRAKERD